MSENKRRVGSYWEKRVADYLSDAGYIVLEMNYRTRFSEIDVIAQDQHFLVFIEVKYRASSYSGNPFEAVDSRKQQRIRNGALSYLKSNGYVIDDTNIRFDVIGIEGDRIEHIKNAF